jgi:hypothetical protein
MADSQSGRKWLLFIGLGLGGVLVISCFVCSVAGYLAYRLTVPPNIVGRWEDEFGHEFYEFRADGTGQFEPQGPRVYPFKYEFVSFSELVLRFPPPPPDAEHRMEELRYEVAYFPRQMQWENLDRRGFYRTLRRIN